MLRPNILSCRSKHTGMQLEERLARLEGMAEEHSKRIDDLRWFFYVTWGVTWGLLIAILSLLIR
jgi:hypothetical protein